MGSITIQFTDEADRGMFVDLLAEAIGKALDGRSKTCQLEVAQPKAEAMEGASPPSDEAKLVDAAGVAAILGVSARMVWRMRDSGRMPRPVSIGRLTRWNRAEIDQWITDGCPRVDRRGPGRR